jgi:hypothetical protein
MQNWKRIGAADEAAEQVAAVSGVIGNTGAHLCAHARR